MSFQRIVFRGRLFPRPAAEHTGRVPIIGAGTTQTVKTKKVGLYVNIGTGIQAGIPNFKNFLKILEG